MSRPRLDERVHPDYHRKEEYAYSLLRSAKGVIALKEKRDQLIYDFYHNTDNLQERTSLTAIRDAFDVLESIAIRREQKKERKEKLHRRRLVSSHSAPPVGQVDAAAYARAQQQYAKDTGDLAENMDLVSSEEEEEPPPAPAPIAPRPVVAAPPISVLEEQLGASLRRPEPNAGDAAWNRYLWPAPAHPGVHPQSASDRNWLWRVPARTIPIPRPSPLAQTVMPANRDPAAWVARIPIPGRKK